MVKTTRQSKLFAMRKSVIAMLMNNTNFDDADTRHRYCPKNIDKWCKHQKDILTGEKTKKDHGNLSVAIKKEVKPIFKDLSSEGLLSKCLDGLTQNNNESINALIWKKCRKDVYVNRNIIEIGVALAVLEFDNGTQGIIRIYENARLHFCKFITAACKRTKIGLV